MSTITLDNAINLIRSSSDVKEIDHIRDEVARLTYTTTKLEEIKSQVVKTIKLGKVGSNDFMVKVAEQAELRKLELRLNN